MVHLAPVLPCCCCLHTWRVLTEAFQCLPLNSLFAAGVWCRESPKPRAQPGGTPNSQNKLQTGRALRKCATPGKTPAPEGRSPWQGPGDAQSPWLQFRSANSAPATAAPGQELCSPPNPSSYTGLVKIKVPVTSL